MSGTEGRSGGASAEEAGSVRWWYKGCPPMLKSPSVFDLSLGPQRRKVESQVSRLRPCACVQILALPLEGIDFTLVCPHSSSLKWVY